MKAPLSLHASAVPALFASGLLALGCQVYDFEPVTPGAVAQQAKSVPLAFNQPKPNLMLLVDKSGSMADPVAPPGGPSKMVVLKQVMGAFLDTSPDAGPPVARVGLARFPNESCVATTATDVLANLPSADAGDSDAVLEAAVAASNAALQTLSPNGGTPTQASLQFIANNIAELDDSSRENFVLLLTDGLPNCNIALDANTCTCTSTAGPPCSLGNNDCLDDVATVAQVKAMRTNNIRTIVIGFGADVVGGIAEDTLEAMADAGGFVRKCPNTNESCGDGNDCVLATGLCSKQYFQATDGTALTEALAEISSSITQTQCVYNLDEVPAGADGGSPAISVVLNGMPYLPGSDTWIYDPVKNQIVFQGALCAQLKTNTPQNPITLDIRLLQIIN
jgi:von Willebrand factor type A domain